MNKVSIETILEDGIPYTLSLSSSDELSVEILKEMFDIMIFQLEKKNKGTQN
jgi:hypothetical protein